MKKIFLILVLMLSTTLSMHAWEVPVGSIEGQVSYFYPFSKKIKKIYGDGWPLYEIRSNQTFCNGWSVWEGISWGNNSGKYKHHKTKLQVLSLKLGLQRFFYFSPCLNFYAGLGASYNFLHVRDKARIITRAHHKKNALGAILQTGVNYFFLNQYYVGAHLEYLYQEFGTYHPKYSYYQSHKVDFDVSGMKIGGSIGFIF